MLSVIMLVWMFMKVIVLHCWYCLCLCFQVPLVEPGHLERSRETMLNRFNNEETMAQIRPLQCLLCRANEAPHLWESVRVFMCECVHKHNIFSSAISAQTNHWSSFHFEHFFVQSHSLLTVPSSAILTTAHSSVFFLLFWRFVIFQDVVAQS